MVEVLGAVAKVSYEVSLFCSLGVLRNLAGVFDKRRFWKARSVTYTLDTMTRAPEALNPKRPKP